MKDFRVVSARHLLKIHSMAPLRGLLPFSVVVSGENLNLSTEVFYNGVLVPEYIIDSASRLIVRVPDGQIGKALTDIRAYTSVTVSKADAEVSFALPKPLQTVEGVDRMVQSWLITFFTSPGSDIFTPRSGGGARSLVGRNTNRKGKGVAADLALAIERTNAELTQMQSKVRNLPLNEKFLSGDLQNLSFDEKTTRLSARVALQNALGNQAQVSFG